LYFVFVYFEARWVWVWAWVESLLLEEEGLVAVDRLGRVRGVVLGKQHLRTGDMTWWERCLDFWWGEGWEEWLGGLAWRLAWHLRHLLPDYYGEHTHGVFSPLLDRLGYDEEQLLAGLERQTLHVTAVLCVAKGSRGQGMGARLARYFCILYIMCICVFLCAGRGRRGPWPGGPTAHALWSAAPTPPGYTGGSATPPGPRWSSGT
jgi:hypothetical protein